MARSLSVAMIIVLLFGFAGRAQAPAQQAAGEPKTVWFFYTVKWGSQDEFLDLFQRNHYPILKEMEKQGLYLSVKTFVPENHGDGRADWTFAVELVEPATRPAAPTEAEIVARLYPGSHQAAERGGAPLRAARGALGRAAEPDRPQRAETDPVAAPTDDRAPQHPTLPRTASTNASISESSFQIPGDSRRRPIRRIPTRDERRGPPRAARGPARRSPRTSASGCAAARPPWSPAGAAAPRDRRWRDRAATRCSASTAGTPTSSSRSRPARNADRLKYDATSPASNTRPCRS